MLERYKFLIKKLLGVPTHVATSIFIDKETIEKFLPNSPSIIDCGAHIGHDTLELAKIPGSKVYAFEAVSSIYNQLHKNTQHVKNIASYQIALAKENGVADMFVSTGASDGSSSLLKPKEHLNDHPEVIFKNTEQVICKTLDSWAAENGIERVDMLWLDMQGAEQDMLSASKKLLNTVKVIHSEVSLKETYEGVKTYKSYKKFLEGKGFKVVVEAIPSGYDMGNVLFVRK